MGAYRETIRTQSDTKTPGFEFRFRGVRDLHLWVYRQAQGCDGRASKRGTAVCCYGKLVRFWRAGCVDALPFLRFRLLGLGVVGSASLWRAGGYRAAPDGPIAPGVLSAAVPRRRNGTESDPERLCAADSGAGGVPGSEARPTGGDLRWRGAGVPHIAAVGAAQRC